MLRWRNSATPTVKEALHYYIVLINRSVAWQPHIVVAHCQLPPGGVDTLLLLSQLRLAVCMHGYFVSRRTQVCVRSLLSYNIYCSHTL